MFLYLFLIFGLYAQPQIDHGPVVDDITNVDYVGTATANLNPPVAHDAGFVTPNNQMVGMVLYAEDSDNNALTYSFQDLPSNGSLPKSTSPYAWNIPEPPRTLYMSNSDFVGVDEFTFLANDGQFNSNVANVIVIVKGRPATEGNDGPPIVSDGGYGGSADNELKMLLFGQDANILTFSIVDEPLNGTVSLEPRTCCIPMPNHHDVSYQPNLGFVGTDSFTYKANDGEFDSNIGTIQVTMKAASSAAVTTDFGEVDFDDAAPIVHDMSFIVASGEFLGFILEAEDDNDVTFSFVTQPQHGTSEIDHSIKNSRNTMRVRYISEPGYVGKDGFIFKAKDGRLDSSIATVRIKVIDKLSAQSTLTDGIFLILLASVVTLVGLFLIINRLRKKT